MLQDGLNPVVAPDPVLSLDVAIGVVERVDDLVDCLICWGRTGRWLQPYDPSIELIRECLKHMNVKVALGSSEDKERVSKVQQESETGDRTCSAGRRRARTSCRRVAEDQGCHQSTHGRPLYLHRVAGAKQQTALGSSSTGTSGTCPGFQISPIPFGGLDHEIRAWT